MIDAVAAHREQNPYAEHAVKYVWHKHPISYANLCAGFRAFYAVANMVFARKVENENAHESAVMSARIVIIPNDNLSSSNIYTLDSSTKPRR